MLRQKGRGRRGVAVAGKGVAVAKKRHGGVSLVELTDQPCFDGKFLVFRLVGQSST